MAKTKAQFNQAQKSTLKPKIATTGQRSTSSSKGRARSCMSRILGTKRSVTMTWVKAPLRELWQWVSLLRQEMRVVQNIKINTLRTQRKRPLRWTGDRTSTLQWRRRLTQVVRCRIMAMIKIGKSTRLIMENLGLLTLIMWIKSRVAESTIKRKGQREGRLRRS